MVSGKGACSVSGDHETGLNGKMAIAGGHMRNRENRNGEEERFGTFEDLSDSDPEATEFPMGTGPVDFPERKPARSEFSETELVDFPERKSDTGSEETGLVDFQEEEPFDSSLEKEIQDENGFASFTDEELDGVYEELEQHTADPGSGSDEIELPESALSSLEKKIADTEGFSAFSDEGGAGAPEADLPEKLESEKEETEFVQIDPEEIGLAEFEEDSTNDDGDFMSFTDSGNDLETDESAEEDFVDLPDRRDQVGDDEKAKPKSDLEIGGKKAGKGRYLKIAFLSAFFPVLLAGMALLLENRGYIELPIHVEVYKTAEKPSDTERENRPPNISDPDTPPTMQPAVSSSKAPKTDLPKLDSIHDKLRTVNEIIGEIGTKRNEISSLIGNYRDGIETVRDEILEEVEMTGEISFRQASQNKKIGLGLAGIRRRIAYIAELERMSDNLLFAAEELLYARRIAEIDMAIADVAEGLDMKMIRTRVDSAIAKHIGKAESLVFHVAPDESATLESVWKRYFGKEFTDSAKKDSIGSIEREIRSGNYGRKHELAKLTPTAAKYLAEWDGRDLYLGGVSHLTPGAARNLAKWKGDWLILNGLETLSPETAEHLFRWKGSRLSLNAVSKLSPEAVRFMAKWEGKHLELASLANLPGKSPENFALLKKWEDSGGKLYLSEHSGAEK